AGGRHGRRGHHAPPGGETGAGHQQRFDRRQRQGRDDMTIDNRGRAAVAGFATLTALLALLAIGGAGCGGGNNTTTIPPINDADAGPPIITTGPYQPLTVGSTWTYHVTDQSVVYDKQSSVDAYEDMGGMAPGVMGYKVRETIKSSIQFTWYENTATDVRR